MEFKKNIGGDINDIFARYKRDTIKIVRESSNGSQTKILNADTICKQLKYPKNELYQKLQKMLGIRIDAKRDIIKGDVDETKLEECLEKIIQKYILCQKCHLPELKDSVCSACGNKNKPIK